LRKNGFEGDGMMLENTMRMFELAEKGYYCSQILLSLALDSCG
jgi:hypothetical protein